MIKSPNRQYTLSWSCWWFIPSLLCHVDIKKVCLCQDPLSVVGSICRGVRGVLRSLGGGGTPPRLSHPRIADRTNYNELNMLQIPLFTEEANFRSIFSYFISLVHLPTLYIPIHIWRGGWDVLSHEGGPERPGGGCQTHIADRGN